MKLSREKLGWAMYDWGNSAYATTVKLDSINLIDPKVVIGLLIGGALPFFIGALTMTSVGRAAGKMVDEIRLSRLLGQLRVQDFLCLGSKATT